MPLTLLFDNIHHTADPFDMVYSSIVRTCSVPQILWQMTWSLGMRCPEIRAWASGRLRCSDRRR